MSHSRAILIIITRHEVIKTSKKLQTAKNSKLPGATR